MAEREIESIDDILNPPDVVEETPVAEEVVAVEEPEEPGVVETQVAAEKEDVTAQIRDELAGLRKERERIRQKEADLDARLADKKEVVAEAKTPNSELKELRKQHREALSAAIIEPSEEADEAVEALEDRMEELRAAMAQDKYKASTTQEKAASEYNTVHAAVHADFPFLAPNHPNANKKLNDNINTYIGGCMAQGQSGAEALRTAVDLFAPAYAKEIGTENAVAETAAVEKAALKAAADKLIVSKLRGGFSEVRSVGKTQGKNFTGPTPMTNILGKT